MPNIKLPDGNSISFEKNVTGLQIAEEISKSLSKQALVISVDGNLRDLNYEKFIEKGEQAISDSEDYNSHNTKRLNVEEMKQLLTKLSVINDSIKTN